MTGQFPPYDAADPATGQSHDRAAVTPAFYNDLAASLAEAWRMLAEAAHDRTKPMHTIAIATLSRDRLPQVRTVVLRDACPNARTIRFHTDLRSPKIAGLTASRAVQGLAYDPNQKIQLRLSGTATIHHGDDIGRAAWAASQPQSRLCYRQHLPPGAILPDPASASARDAHDGKINFAAIQITVSEIDWLYLAAAGHRRARFIWDNAGQLASTWLGP